MKYTRYDIKRDKKKGNYFFIIITVVLFVGAYIIATLIFNLIIKNSGVKNIITPSPAKAEQTESNKNTQNKSMDFIVLQCGSFQDKSHADSVLKDISAFHNCFIVQSGSNSKVIAGIYEDKDVDKHVKILTDNKIDNAKISFEVDGKNLCDVEISGIIDANLQILNKFDDKTAKMVKTSELKKWTSSLKEVPKDSANYSTLKDLKEHTKSLPDQISSDKINEIYTYLYDILNKIKSV